MIFSECPPDIGEQPAMMCPKYVELQKIFQNNKKAKIYDGIY